MIDVTLASPKRLAELVDQVLFNVEIMFDLLENESMESLPAKKAIAFPGAVVAASAPALRRNYRHKRPTPCALACDARGAAEPLSLGPRLAARNETKPAVRRATDVSACTRAKDCRTKCA